MRLGDVQSFADAPSLLAYCTKNPNVHAGYAPMGQSNPQTLPCQEWPYILSKGQTIVVSGGSTSSAVSLASTTVFGIPLWVLAVGALGLFLYMRRHG